MTAGVAQFDADRTLSFFNQPFAVMAQIEPDWLAEKPEFDRLLERMRENRPPARSARFPGMEERAARLVHFAPTRSSTEDWILASGDHWRVVAQPLPDGGLRMIFEDRTEQVRLASARDTLLRVRTATFDNLFEAISVFASDGRLYLWNKRFSEVWELDEEWLVRASPGRRTGAGDGAQAGQPDRRRAGPRNGAQHDQRPPLRHRPRVDDRRPPFRVRRRAAARRQRAFHDDRRHRFLAGSRRRFASARRRWRRPTRSRPTSSPT